jgi:hypothetical protein
MFIKPLLIYKYDEDNKKKLAEFNHILMKDMKELE